MCISTQYKELPDIKEAYKIFSVVEDTKNELFGIFYKYQFKKRRWICDTNNDQITCTLDAVDYIPGFHCYVHKEAALRYIWPQYEVIHRVLVKEIVACGLHNKFIPESLTVVARKIYIMERITS